MADRSKLEQMLESLVNGDQAKAEELFHEYVVAQSREIYESLIESELEEEADDEEVEEGMEVTFKETDDEEMGGDPTDDLAGEMDAGDDEFGGEMGPEEGEESEEEIMQDLGAIIDELQAKFDALSGAEEEQGEFGDEEGEEGGEFGGEEEGGEEEEMVDSMDNELATVREYVEKVGTDWDKNGLRKEGEYSGTGSQSDSISINSKSTVASKNDMGGTSANILRADTENGVEANKGQLKGNGLLKGKPQQMNTGNVNVPGGNAGKTGFKHKEPGHGAEKKGPAEGQFSGKGGSAGTVDKASLFRGRR